MMLGEYTGDPFVDVGKLVMDTLPQESVEEKIGFATVIYVDRWKGAINSVFLHSKITNLKAYGKPAVQKKGSLEYYLGLLSARGTGECCRICGREGALPQGGRDTCPLVGSGEFINFHHFHEPRLFLCPQCLIKLFFVPLGILQSGDYLMLLQVQNSYAKRLWQDLVIRENLDKISRNSSDGILKSSYVNPRAVSNALFHFAARMIEKFDHSELPLQQLRLLRFTNFGPKPDVQIYDLPKPVFSFLKRVLLKADLKTDWLRFVKRHYRLGRSSRFDDVTEEWCEVRKKETVVLGVRDYDGSSSNRVHEYLLTGRSILPLLVRMHRTASFPIMIVMVYMREVREMRQEQIDLIRSIADKIIALAQREGDYKKFLTPVEGARYAYQLRAAILRLAKAHYVNGEPEPFVRLADYVDYLFPDGRSWYETRDLLLICLYEKLHDLRVEPTAISDGSTVEIPEPEADAVDEFNLEE